MKKAFGDLNNIPAHHHEMPVDMADGRDRPAIGERIIVWDDDDCIWSALVIRYGPGRYYRKQYGYNFYSKAEHSPIVDWNERTVHFDSSDHL